VLKLSWIYLIINFFSYCPE